MSFRCGDCCLLITLVDCLHHVVNECFGRLDDLSRLSHLMLEHVRMQSKVL